MRFSCVLAISLALNPALPAEAQDIDFGDDSGPYAHDGECDDPRFEGPGTAAPPLQDFNLRRDATDCETSFRDGTVSLRSDWEEQEPIVIDGIEFGVDTSPYARNGECDDPRFEGPGMTSTPLLDSDLGRDASDCSNAYAEGRLALRGEWQAPDPVVIDGVDFGDDASPYSQDGECDDPRFEGPGMTTTPLLDSDLGHDATDCSTAWTEGRIALAGEEPETAPILFDGIEFGDDASPYSQDGECDDPRFAGPAMASQPLLERDRGHDATDCLDAYRQGRVSLQSAEGPGPAADRPANPRRGGSRLR